MTTPAPWRWQRPRVGGLIALAAVVLSPSGAAAAVPAIDVVAAPGVTCPSSDAVRAALARVRGAPATGPATFQLVIAGTAEQAHLELRDSAGSGVLARDIPMAATDCSHAAEAIALIVERHFRTLRWSPASEAGEAPSPAAPARPTAPPPLPARPAPVPFTPVAPDAASPSPPISPAPSQPAPSPTEESPVVETATAVATPPERPAPPQAGPLALPRFVLGAGPAFWSRGDTFAAALDARWRVRAGSPFELGAAVLVPPLHASAPIGSGGSVHVGAVPIAASAGLAAALGGLAANAHLGLLWTIERGQSESIPTPATAWRTVLGLGVGLSAAWPVSAHLRIAGALDGYRTVLGRSYAISGVPGSVLDPSPWQAVVVLGAEWVLRP